MKVVGAIMAGILAVLFASALAIGGYWGFGYMVDVFKALEPQLATVLAILSVVALLCAIIVASGLKGVGRREAEARIRVEKVDLYEKILLHWGGILSNRTTVLDPSVLEDLHKLERILTLRGSAKVLNCYGEFQGCAKTNGLYASELPSLLTKLTLEMRKDLGEGVVSLNESELVNVLNVDTLRDSSPSTSHVGRPQVSLSHGA